MGKFPSSLPVIYRCAPVLYAVCSALRTKHICFLDYAGHWNITLVSPSLPLWLVEMFQRERRKKWTILNASSSSMGKDVFPWPVGKPFLSSRALCFSTPLIWTTVSRKRQERQAEEEEEEEKKFLAFSQEGRERIRIPEFPWDMVKYTALGPLSIYSVQFSFTLSLSK